MDVLSDQVDPRIIEVGGLEKLVYDATSRVTLIEESYHLLKGMLNECIERNGVSVLSLDVFDTILLRNNKPEAQRYYELAECCAEAFPSHHTALDFYVTRAIGMEVSYRARPAKDACREGHIDEVLTLQANLLGLQAGARERLKEIEIDYEAKNLVANRVLLDVAKGFKSAGGTVILVSDMYLDSPAIKQLVDRVIGDPSLFDTIFSSADLIISKRSGRVFPYIAELLRRTSNEFLHIGDSLVGDVRRAREAGWAAQHFPISRTEEIARKARLNEFVTQMDSHMINVRQWAQL